MSLDKVDLDNFYTNLSQIYGANDARQSGYQFSWWFRRVSDIVKRLLGAHDVDSTFVIDLGCGGGLFLQRVFPGGTNLFGVDYNEVMCRRALERGINAIRADIFRLPFKDFQATTVCCINVLQQFEPDAVSNLLVSISKLLQPDGALVLVWRNNSNTLHQIARLKSFIEMKKDKSPAWYGHSLQAIAEQLRSNNFQIKSTCLIAPILGISLPADSALGNLFGTEFFALAVKQGRKLV